MYLTLTEKIASPSGITPPQSQCGDSEYTISDIDGNIYNTVKMGNQCWMRENLNTTKDPSGASITRYCYSEIVGNCDVYGELYVWATIMNGQASSVAILSGGPGDLP